MARISSVVVPGFLHHVTPRGVRSMRLEGYKKIMETRKAFLKARVKSDTVYKESKKQLEVRPWAQALLDSGKDLGWVKCLDDD